MGILRKIIESIRDTQKKQANKNIQKLLNELTPQAKKHLKGLPEKINEMNDRYDKL